MSFKSVIGQEALRDQLIHSTRENRVSHALLFHGPPGSGKFPLAVAFAQYLNCSDPGPEDACGVCPACQKAEKFIHPDIHFVFPVITGTKAGSEPVSDNFIADWREYLAESPYPSLPGWLKFMKVENKQAKIFKKEAASIVSKLQLKAFESDYKILIIWMPEKMNATAANKLLKIIEEPPEKTIFLLVAQSTGDILPTILSRTQLIRVKKIPDEVLSQHLIKKYPDKEKLIAGITRLADGNYLEAVDLIEANEQNQIYFDHFVNWMRLIYSFKISELLAFMPTIVELGREKQKDFLLFCLKMIKGNFHLNQKMDDIVRMSPEQKDFSVKFSKYINTGNIADLSLLFSEAISQIGMNANPRILFLDMSTRIFKLLRKPVSE